MTVNGRDQATDILSGTDALVAAAEAARLACYHLETGKAPDEKDYLSDWHLERAERAARTAQGLSVYAATVGKWAAR
jgi:hypothetical protein